jgi:hypothetical protein
MVAEQERENYDRTLEGFYGEEKKSRAERLGLRGTSEYTQEVQRRKGWVVCDLVTGEKYFRPFEEKMHKQGWVKWRDLPPGLQKVCADRKPEDDRRAWFKFDVVAFELQEWEPEIESISDDPIGDYA